MVPTRLLFALIVLVSMCTTVAKPELIHYNLQMVNHVNKNDLIVPELGDSFLLACDRYRPTHNKLKVSNRLQKNGPMGTVKEA